MICKRCGQDTPRLTLTQRYCPTCQREVAERERQDQRRFARRFTPKALTGVPI